MQASSEIREVILGWFKAAVAGDVSWRDHHVSTDPDLRIVGTDPEEWLKGQAAYRFLKDEAENIGGKVTVDVEEVEAFVEGSVGWGLAKPRITLPDGNSVTPRWSAVFRQEEGAWKMVQLHASIGLTNEQAFGMLFSQT